MVGPTDFIPRLVDEAAAQWPDKVAFRCGDADVTYADLAVRSNQLAHTLVGAGLRAGELAGIYMGKSLENATAVYGIQKAGAAYVPIDPRLPAERALRIISDCGIRHIVTDQRHAPAVFELAGRSGTVGHIFGPDSSCLVPESVAPRGSIAVTGWAEISAAPSTTPAVRSADDVAYIIFTSGSTGVPKGIVHTHASGAAYARMAARLYGLRHDDRLSNFPPLHFDQSTFDFFSGVIVGATTVIISEQHQLVPASLASLIERERLTIWYSVPFALVRLLLYGALAERDLSTLRWVIYGGEPFPVKHLAALMAHWPHARFSNCYGPAETNQCTYHHVPSNHELAQGLTVPIGTPCDGVVSRIVDPQGADVPVGSAGELLIHAPTTMSGYWAAPELTAAAFEADHPHGVERRFYRTGDVVRRRADGLLEFIGRKDRQVKIRGQRVELDEVESVLAAHPDVREAAVFAVGESETTAVHARIVRDPATSPEPKSIVRFASGRLPRYAVPVRITIVERLPRTPNGKFDYTALSREEKS